MTRDTQVDIAYFTDLLCVWAYVAEARVQELTEQLGDEVIISRHYFNLFGDTRFKIGEGWRKRGGYDGFAKHVHEVAADFGHVETGPEIWASVRPPSSTPAHLWLKACHLVEGTEPTSDKPSDQFSWALRLAFFRDGLDVASHAQLAALAADSGLEVAALEQELASGRAHAALAADERLKERYRIEGSPTFVLNDGRQKLYGNVGYRVLEANVRELLNAPSTDAASWC